MLPPLHPFHRPFGSFAKYFPRLPCNPQNYTSRTRLNGNEAKFFYGYRTRSGDTTPHYLQEMTLIRLHHQEWMDRLCRRNL